MKCCIRWHFLARILNEQAVIIDQNKNSNCTAKHLIPTKVRIKPGGGGGDIHIGPVGDVPNFRASIFKNNSRTGFEISPKISRTGIGQIYPKGSPINENSDLMHVFHLIFLEQICVFPNIFPEQGKRIFPGGHFPFICLLLHPLSL